MTRWHHGYVHLLYTVYNFGERDYISRNICICVWQSSVQCTVLLQYHYQNLRLPLIQSYYTWPVVAALNVTVEHVQSCFLSVLFLTCWILVNVCGYFADIIKGNTGTNCIKSILLVPFCMASCRISCLAWSLEARELLVRNSFTF